MTFNELQIGTTFRALRNDVVGKGPVARIVKNDGVYLKTGANTSIDLETGKDCVFLMRMPCKKVGRNG